MIERFSTSSDEAEVTKTVAGRRRIRVHGATLRVVTGPDRGAIARMQTPAFSIGKGNDVDFRLSDDRVSRRHLELTSTAEGLLLRDLQSHNGTWLGGCRLTEALVLQNVILKLGRSSIEVQLDKESFDLEVSGASEFGGAIGTSVAMRHVFAVLEQVADSISTVLLEGESGTGKEVLARALHARSPRADGPFVVVDCASLPENLVEAELFGHERGAFTGAIETRAGAFERASGGTIFLDELGELPLPHQAKLLRVLESREVKRIGGGKAIPVDVRVLAATNVRLSHAVQRAAFREDLYYRLSVVRVVVPPLRDRKQDIPALAHHFLAATRGIEHEVPADLIPVLTAHAWPGNVRELRNVMERWAMFQKLQPDVLFGDGDPASRRGATVPSGLGDLSTLPYHEAKRRALEAFDRAYFPEVLRRVNGVVAKAAEQAQVPRPSFHRMLARTRDTKGRSGADD